LRSGHISKAGSEGRLGRPKNGQAVETPFRSFPT
jgi:hypothetical protein